MHSLDLTGRVGTCMLLNMWLDIDYLKYVWFVTWVDGSEFRA